MPPDSEMPRSDISEGSSKGSINKKERKKTKKDKNNQSPQLFSPTKESAKNRGKGKGKTSGGKTKTIGNALHEENQELLELDPQIPLHIDPPASPESEPAKRKKPKKTAKNARNNLPRESSPEESSESSDSESPQKRFKEAPIFTEAAMNSILSSLTANMVKACKESFENSLSHDHSAPPRRVRKEPYPRADVPEYQQTGQLQSQAPNIMPCGSLVPLKLQQKIIEGKYINLRSLLPVRESRKSSRGNKTHDSDDDEDTDETEELSQWQWIQCFYDYIAVYTKEYPSATESILAYAKYITRLMEDGKDWRTYDITFRKAREARPYLWTDLLFDTRLDLKDKKQDKPSKPSTSNKQFFRESSGPSVAPGYCYGYHRRNTRCENSPCTFNHKCQICNGPHPLFKHDYFDRYSAPIRRNFAFPFPQDNRAQTYQPQRFYAFPPPSENYFPSDHRYSHSDNRNFSSQRNRNSARSPRRSSDAHQLQKTSRNAGGV